MIIAVFLRNQELAQVTLHAGQGPTFNEGADQKFVKFFTKAMEGEITALHDVHEKNVHLKVLEPVRPSDPNFYLAVIQWLERQGYDVLTLHPEVDEEIGTLLDQLPVGHTLKSEIERVLPTATYLEKTYLLEQLRKGSHQARVQ